MIRRISETTGEAKNIDCDFFIQNYHDVVKKTCCSDLTVKVIGFRLVSDHNIFLIKISHGKKYVFVGHNLIHIC